MPGPLDTSVHTTVRMPGGKNPRIVSFHGTTAANGDLTIATGLDYDGSLTVARATNAYTVTVGAYERCRSVHCAAHGATTLHPTGFTFDAAAGTVVIQFGATVNTLTMVCTIVLDG